MASFRSISNTLLRIPNTHRGTVSVGGPGVDGISVSLQNTSQEVKGTALSVEWSGSRICGSVKRASPMIRSPSPKSVVMCFQGMLTDLLNSQPR